MARQADRLDLRQAGTLGVLNGKLSLHDIEDVEVFTLGIAHRFGAELNHHDREDLHVYLIETCWELSLRYEEGKGSTSSFIGWATTNLRLRCVDWLRKRHGRSRYVFHDRVYERPRPVFVSLDDRLEQPHTLWSLDAPDAGVTDVLGVLREGGGPDAREAFGVGGGANGKVAA